LRIFADRDALATPGKRAQSWSAIIKFNPIRIGRWKRDPYFVRSSLLTPTAITLQFQGGVDSAIDGMRRVAFAGAQL